MICITAEHQEISLSRKHDTVLFLMTRVKHPSRNPNIPLGNLGCRILTKFSAAYQASLFRFGRGAIYPKLVVLWKSGKPYEKHPPSFPVSKGSQGSLWIPRQHTWHCFVCATDGVTLYPVNQRDTDQSGTSVSLCM